MAQCVPDLEEMVTRRPWYEADKTTGPWYEAGGKTKVENDDQAPLQDIQCHPSYSFPSFEELQLEPKQVG